MATLPENLPQLSQMIPKPEKDIGCQALVETAGVLKHGFLRKMPDSWGGRLFDSMLNKKWTSKFVILRSGCVYIYSSETASNYDRAYSLFGFQEALQCEGDFYKAGRWTFQVFDALQDSSRDRSMYFSASSETDMKDWIDAFQTEICQGNFAVLNATASYSRFKQRPSVDMPAERRLTMPQIPEELREKMRRSIALEKNVNICYEEKGSSSGSDDDSVADENQIDTAARMLRRPLPVPPSLHGTEDVAKGETTAVVGATPKPLPKPIVEKLKPTLAPVKPVRQVYPSAPVVFISQKQDSASSPPPPAPAKPAKYGLASALPPPPLKPVRQTPASAVLPTPVIQVLQPTLPRTGLAKPTSAVKPVQPQPPEASGPSNFRDRMVPQPPSFLRDLRQAVNDRSTEDVEEMGIYDEDDDDDYEHCASGEECMNDPLIRASYWRQESGKALKIMQSINKSGVFLIRDSAEGLDFKTLMVCVSEIDSTVRKYKITKESAQTYSLHLGQSGFQSLKELIQYYQKNPLPNRHLTLTKPYLEVWKSN